MISAQLEHMQTLAFVQVVCMGASGIVILIVVKDDQIGGLAAATRFPLQPGMGLDVFFSKPESGAGSWKPGFYRGIVDTATKPTAKTKSQKVEIWEMTKDKALRTLPTCQ